MAVVTLMALLPAAMATAQMCAHHLLSAADRAAMAIEVNRRYLLIIRH